MLIFLFSFLALVVLTVLAYAVMMYNSLVRLQREVNKSWSNIDVLLKQRSEELPNLIDTVKQYMDYESGVLQEVTRARTRVEEAQSPEEQARADREVRHALDNLLAVAEDYPELKADENFQQLQNRISEIEDKIADRREYYNQSVNTYNIRIHQVPYNLMADLMNYTDRTLFEASDQEREQVDVQAQFAAK